MVIAGSVKPGQIVEALHLDDKRVAVPPAVRPPIQVKEQKIDTPLRRFTQSWNHAGELSADGTTISGVTSSIQGGAQLVFRKDRNRPHFFTMCAKDFSFSRQ